MSTNTETTVISNGETLTEGKPAAPSTPASRKPAGKVRTGNPQTDRAVRAASTKAPANGKAPAKPRQSRATRSAAQAKADSKPGLKPEPKPAKSSTAEGKRDLATRVISAISDMVISLDASELKAIGMTKKEAAQCVSNWVHHLPADRKQWLTMLPRPTRSDWA